MAESDSRRARSFGAAADVYARARPTYPPAAVDWVAGAAPGRRALDVGAGTGKLTGVLVGAGLETTAVEPDPAMLATLRAGLPAAIALLGAAEALPVDDGSADLAVVGQAFHWFDHPRALDELARVLAPGGVLGLIWNVRDERVDWVRELTESLGTAGRDGSTRLAVHSAVWRPLLAAHPAFGPVEEGSFEHAQTLTVDGLVDLLASRSGVLTATPAERERLLQVPRALARRHPALAGRETFELPYVTRVFRAQRS